MKKVVEKIMALMLMMGVMITSSSMVAMAAPAETQTTETLQVEGIDQFFSKNVDGTMSFDSMAASMSGYNQTTVDFVQENVDMINQLVVTKGVSIADDYSVTICTDNNQLGSKAARTMARAKGQSKVVVWATGMVLVYMNTSETNDLYSALSKVGAGCTLLGIVPTLIAAKAIISQACSVGIYVASVSIVAYQSQINQVRKNGTGIIMYVAPMPDGIGSSVSFGAQ